LVENHREFLRYVERRVGNRAIAEELLQDAFVRGLARGGEITGKDITADKMRGKAARVNSLVARFR